MQSEAVRPFCVQEDRCHMKKRILKPLTSAALMAELIVFVTLNITGFPVSFNPVLPPFKSYGGNRFGWPFNYHSTNLTASQWQQMQMPDGGRRLPAGAALKPTTLFASQDSAEFIPVHIGWNVLIACAIFFWTAVTLELWLAPGQRIPSRAFWLLVLLVCAIVLLSQSGIFYHYCYVPYNKLWKLATRLAGLTLLFAPAIVSMTRKLRMRQLYRATNLRSAPSGVVTEEDPATYSPYAPPGTTAEGDHQRGLFD